MLTDKNRQATTAWKPLWILAGNQTGTINCQPSNNNNKEKWFRTLLHFTFLYEIYAASKTRATKIENEQGNCFLYNVRCTL